MSVLANNRQAYHDYDIIEEFEAGIQLTGAEVKSLKNGRGQLKGSYIKVHPDNQVYLYNCHIAPYQHAIQENYVADSPRKLLLNRSEIEHLKVVRHGQNLTIIPLKIYTLRQGLIKLQIALARGKKQYEKRHILQERESKREIERTLKRYQ